MKKPLLAAFLMSASLLPAQTPKPQTFRENLLETLRTTHNQKDWFVPVMIALDGVTAEQANWTDKSGNHSVGQLAYHLLFWNKSQLDRLQGRKPAAFNGDNNETFTKFDPKQWKSTVEELDHVLTELEKVVESADEDRLKRIASSVSHIGTHNAYHTGQIINVRRLQGSWDPEKGVK